MLTKEVLWCSIEHWYPLFKKVTFKTTILHIPNECIEYLRSDGSLILPLECNEEDSNEESDDEDDNEHTQPSFPEFNKLILEAIERLGGQVFPKLNWSAPRDASWMGLGNSPRCENLSSIWLLLKSSEFITHDLTQPFKDCTDFSEENCPEICYVLALKKWSTTINPATEFRCFIKSKKLIAIEQRDASNFYPHISEERRSIICDIKSFYDEHVVEKLGELNNIVMDVTRPTKDHVKLIDFNPFGVTTDTKLFNWVELEEFSTENQDVEFRHVESEGGIQPSGLRHYSLPKDIVDLASGEDHEKLVDFLKLQSDMQNKENDSD